MKLLEQLQSPKLWSVVIGLLVSAGLIQFSDSQAGEIVGALSALFTAVGVIVTAVLSQQGDNAANVETMRSIGSRQLAREIPMLERNEPVNDALWRRINELEQQVAALQRDTRDGRTHDSGQT